GRLPPYSLNARRVKEFRSRAALGSLSWRHRSVVILEFLSGALHAQAFCPRHPCAAGLVRPGLCRTQPEGRRAAQGPAEAARSSAPRRDAGGPVLLAA